MKTEKLTVRKIIKPLWIKKAVRNEKARERYHMKRYGNLERLEAKERLFQKKMDDISFDDELKATEA